jgi:hypothetical protein
LAHEIFAEQFIASIGAAPTRRPMSRCAQPARRTLVTNLTEEEATAEAVAPLARKPRGRGKRFDPIKSQWRVRGFRSGT